MDVTNAADAREAFAELVSAMGSVDLVVISAGVGHLNRDLEWGPERETIDVNVRGFTAIATAAMDHFDRGGGHLVGILLRRCEVWQSRRTRVQRLEGVRLDLPRGASKPTGDTRDRDIDHDRRAGVRRHRDGDGR